MHDLHKLCLLLVEIRIQEVIYSYQNPPYMLNFLLCGIWTLM